MRTSGLVAINVKAFRVPQISAEIFSKREAGGMKTAQSVYAAARRRRRGAEVEAFFGGRIHARGGTQEHLREILNATVDVAADEVRVVIFEI